MAKFKPAKGKAKTAPAPPGAIPCVVMVIAGVLLVMLFLYFVMKNSG